MDNAMPCGGLLSLPTISYRCVVQPREYIANTRREVNAEDDRCSKA
jgi:hypothetical protein